MIKKRSFVPRHSGSIHGLVVNTSEFWNIYCFQFSDGDNWGEDNREALNLLRDELVPQCNLFCYGQVESPYGSGEFIKSLESAFADKEAIYSSIKKNLGKGK